MKDTAWSEITANLNARDTAVCVAAAARLHREADISEVPRLLGLLESNDFFVREAAAWPLAELAGAQVLGELLTAYQRGFDEGHDNDGFTAALLEIPALHGEAAVQAIRSFLKSSSGTTKEHAGWLLTFCETQ
jgi:hypothetical protein